MPTQVVGRGSAVIWWEPALAMSRVAPGAAISAWGAVTSLLQGLPLPA